MKVFSSAVLFLTVAPVAHANTSGSKKSKKGSKKSGKSDVCDALGRCTDVFNPKAPKGTKLSFDQDVTPDTFFGTGNANGGYTISENDHLNIEVGLRGKLRFDTNGNAQNTFNSNGDGTYSFDAGLGGAPGGNQDFPTPEWGFEWSVNVNTICDALDCEPALDSFDYELGLDGATGCGTNFYAFDPINQPCLDHNLGILGTDQGTDVSATCTAGQLSIEYQGFIGQYAVAQQSWRYPFFPVEQLQFFNPFTPGIYTIYLKVLEKGTSEILAQSTIHLLIGMPEMNSDCEQDGFKDYGLLFADEDQCTDYLEDNIFL